MKIKNKYLLFLLVPCSLCLVTCSNKDQSSKKIFRYNESTGIASLDPAFSKNQSTMWPVHQLFNTLIESDGDTKTRGSLAKNWDISADRTEYIFHLRTDVFFHDNPAFGGTFAEGKGRKMIASDVEYSFKRILDPKIASPGFYIFNNVVDSAAGFTAIDDSTFRLKLIKPYAPILQILKMTYCSVVPKEVVEKYGSDFRSHPCGTGPFQFVAWEEGLALIFRKNENYFEKDAAGYRLPYLDGIKITFNESKATEFLLFRQKQLDFLNDIDASFKDEILTLKGELRNNWKDKVALQIHPYLNTEYFGFLVDSTNEIIKNSPTRLKKLRQAMNYAIDRRKMILYLRNSLSSPAESGFVPEGMPSFDTSVTGYNYDPQKSKRLLQEAGFTSGTKPPVIKLYTIPIYGEIGSYLAKQFEEAGIPVTVEVVLRSFLFELTSNSKAPFFRGSWIADYADAFNYLSCFYSKNPAPPNYTRYNNAEFDKVFEQAVAEPNDSLRYILYRKADQILINDAPIIPLWYDRVIRLVQPNISGFEPNNLNWLELRTAKKES